MKKLIALILSISLMLSILPVSAAKEISLDFLITDCQNGSNLEYESRSSYEVKLNKSIGILDAVTEMIGEELPIQPFDIRMMAESVFALKGEATVKQRITDNGNKMSAFISLKSNLPFAVNGRLSADIESSENIWMEWDNEEGKLEYIMDTPISSSKYIYFNEGLFNVTDETVDVFGLMKEIISSEKSEKFEKLFIDSVRSNAVITGNNSKVKLVFTDIGLKKLVADVVLGYFRLYGESLNIPEDAFSDEQIAGIIAMLSSIRLFDDEALILNYSLDSKGRVIKSDCELNVDMNIFDILSAFGIQDEKITKENSNISFTLSAKTGISYKKVNITKPVLTEENSMNIADMINTTVPEYDYETEFEEYYYPWAYVEFEGDSFFANGGDYIPLRNLLESFEYTVTYNNGVIKATNDSKFAEYSWLEVYMNSNAVITSGNKFFMESPVVNIDGKAYIKFKDAELLMNSYIDYVGCHPQENYINVSFTRNKAEEDFE